MKQADTYTPKPFDLHGLNGISDCTIDMPMKLYDGLRKRNEAFHSSFTHLLCDVGWSSQKWGFRV